MDKQANRRARSAPGATLNPGRLNGSQGVTTFLKVTEAAQQLQQVEQSLKIQQARVAIQVLGALAVTRGRTAAVQLRQGPLHLLSLIASGGVEIHKRRDAFSAIRQKLAGAQGSLKLPDHQLWEGTRPLLIPSQAKASGVRNHQPNHSTGAGSSNRWVSASRQGRCAWVASISTDCPAATACRIPSCSSVSSSGPVALNLRVAARLLADPIAGEHLGLEQRRQQSCSGGLAARRRIEQLVAAQGGHGNGLSVWVMRIPARRCRGAGAKNQRPDQALNEFGTSLNGLKLLTRALESFRPKPRASHSLAYICGGKPPRYCQTS